MAAGTNKRYKGRTTPYVVMTCIVAASGGEQQPPVPACLRSLLARLLRAPVRDAAQTACSESDLVAWELGACCSMSGTV